MIVIAQIEVSDERLAGELLTVGAAVDWATTVGGGRLGVTVSEPKARLHGVPMPLTPWERVLAVTAIEMQFLKLHRLAWEDRAA